MSISLSKILRKNVSPNAWALTAQIRSQFSWPWCSTTLQKAWKLVLMGSCYTMRRTGLKRCHWPWIQSEGSCNICDAVLGSPRAYLWRGVLDMETEVRAEIHVIAAFQPDGRACSYLLAWTPMTASKEHLLLRDAQAQKKPKAELWAGREVENHAFLHKTLP